MKTKKITYALACSFMCLLFWSTSLLAQSLTTDQADYPPGSTVILTGSGFAGGELVTIQVLHNPTGGDDATSPSHQPWDVEADGDGNFTTTWNVPEDEDELGASLIATADAQASGSHAEALFTDDINATVTSVVGNPAGSPNCVHDDSGGSNHRWYLSAGHNYTMTITMTSGCTGSVISVRIGGLACFDASNGGSGNVYTGNFTMVSQGSLDCGLTVPIRLACGSGNCSGGSGSLAHGLNGEAQTHLVQTNYDANCNDIGCSSNPCTTSITSNTGNACAGHCATLSADYIGGGTPTYLWSTTETTQSITVCTSGTYSVTATDGNCSSSSSISIDDCIQCPPISCSISGDNSAACGSSHTYTIDVQGCSGNPTISWSVTGDASIVGASNGTSVDVQANNTCGGSYNVHADAVCSCATGPDVPTSCDEPVSITGSTPELANVPEGGDLGCNNGTPSCDPNVTASTICGIVEVNCSAGQIQNNGCAYSQTFTYSASCGDLSTSQDVNYTWHTASALVFDNLPSGGNRGCDNPPSCQSVTATNECGTVNATCTPGNITSNGCYRSQSFHYHATAACGAAADADVSYTWKVSSGLSLNAPNTLPVCGLGGYTLSVTNNGPGTITSYSWTVSGAGWAITSATNVNPITYTAGNSGVQGTFTVVVTNSCGCTSSATVTFGSSCVEGCSYTQGFYGSPGSNCSGQNAVSVITAALNQGNLVLGTSGHSLTFRSSPNDAVCLNSHMPAGTTPAQLPAHDYNCSQATNNQYLSNNKYVSVLLGQVLALGLNLRNTSGLGSIPITGAYITTYAATACSSGKAIPGTKLVKGPIPASVLTALNNSGNNTIANLWTLANNALGNGSSNPSLSNWTAACDAINNAFDQCRILVGFGSSSGGLKLDETATAVDNSISGLNLYPNPTSGQLTIAFIAPEGTTSIDVYNVSGMLVYHSQTTEQTGGISMQQNLDASNWADGVYFVRLSSTDNSVVGKVIVSRQ